MTKKEKQSLTNRAATMVNQNSKLVAALALTSLSAAPAAADIVFTDPGSVTSTGGETTFGGPLQTFSGNGTDQVALAGEFGINGFQLAQNTSIEFTNQATITAVAGESLVINYDFAQNFASSSGGSITDITDVAFLLDVEINGTSIANQTGAESFNNIPISPLTTGSQNGSFTSAPFATDLNNASLTLTFSNTTSTTAGPPLDIYSIQVPQTQNGIQLSIQPVPEPSGVLLFAALVLAVACRRVRKCVPVPVG